MTTLLVRAGPVSENFGSRVISNQKYPGATMSSTFPIRAGAMSKNSGCRFISSQNASRILLGLDNVAAMHRSSMPLAPLNPNSRQGTRRNRSLSIRSKTDGFGSAELTDNLSDKKAADDGVVCLVLGSGGREHSLCYGLRRSASCMGVFCAPGNAGISSSGDATCVSNLDITDSAAVASFCKEWGVGLVVVGPEGPLVSGLVDDLIDAGIPTFGPSAAAAALEGSKSFMKRLCDKYHIPTAQVLMLRFRSDLVQVLLAACQGQLKGTELNWADDPALVIVMASKGYPGNYQKGSVIKNLEEAEGFGQQVKLFHAGTALDSEQNMVAVGGRVLGVTAMGKDIADAQKKAYQVVDCINWPEGFCRRDIGWRAVARLNTDELNSIEEAL
ncbi:unnamed protein product [Calypogeia fissa]